MPYTPGKAPIVQTQEAKDLLEYVERELSAIARSSTNEREALINQRNAEPIRPREGHLVYADGTNWDPGSGQGFYVYAGGAWLRLTDDSLWATLGTAAFLNVGTSANNIVQLDGSSKLPAVDGSALTLLQLLPGFLAQSSAGQSIASGALDKVQFSTEVWDSGGYYDPTVNYRFTPQKAGRYFVFALIAFNTLPDGKISACTLKKNGSSIIAQSNTAIGSATASFAQTMSIVSLNGSSDYVEAFAYNGDTGSQALHSTAEYNQFLGFRIAA